MRTWRRVIVPMLCGGCNRELRRGDPVSEIEFVFLGGKPIHCWRCDTCVGPAPPDLPELVARSHAITPTPLTRLAAVLPFHTPLADWRKRASGEREPGEEG